MNANLFGAVARRQANHFNRDSGLNARNRILTASCLFNLARLSQELTAETIDLWLKAVSGQIRGFSQIHLLDVCREFVLREPKAFRSLWENGSETIYPALSRLNVDDDPYRKILKCTLFAIAEECYAPGDQQAKHLENKLQVEQSLTSDEWLDIVYLKTDFRRFLNAEIAELALKNLVSPPMSSEFTVVEVIL